MKPDVDVSERLARAEAEIASLKAENASLKRYRHVCEQAHAIVRNQREGYAHRIVDLEILLSHPLEVLEGKEMTLNVAQTRSAIGIGHNTMADYLAAKAQSGGIEYRYETLKQGAGAEGEKPTFKNESIIRPLPAAFTQTDTKTAEATLKQKTANKKSELARLEKLKQSLLVCPSCGDSEHMHVGLEPICGACGHRGEINYSDPAQVLPAASVRVVIEGESQEPQESQSPEPAQELASAQSPSQEPEGYAMVLSFDGTLEPVFAGSPAQEPATSEPAYVPPGWIPQETYVF